MMQQMFTFGELAVLALAWNGSGLVVGGFEDTTVRCWRVDGGDERAYVMKWAMTRHTAEVAAVAFDPSGEFVISGSADGTVRLTRAATGRCARVFRCGPEPVPEVVPSWNRRTRLPSRPVTLPVVAVASVAAPGGVLFAAYVDAARTPDISARLSFGAGRADDHAATNGPQIWALDLPEDDALDDPPTELSPDGDDDDDDDDDPGHIDWAAAAARLAEQRGRVELDVSDETDEEAEAEALRNLVSEDKRLHRCVVPSNRGGGSVAFSPCGRFLATAAEAPSTPLAGDGRCKMKAGYVTQIHVFDTASGAPIAAIDTTSQETSHVAWSPCGSALVAAGIAGVRKSSGVASGKWSRIVARVPRAGSSGRSNQWGFGADSRNWKRTTRDSTTSVPSDPTRRWTPLPVAAAAPRWRTSATSACRAASLSRPAPQATEARFRIVAGARSARAGGAMFTRPCARRNRSSATKTRLLKLWLARSPESKPVAAPFSRVELFRNVQRPRFGMFRPRPALNVDSRTPTTASQSLPATLGPRSVDAPVSRMRAFAS